MQALTSSLLPPTRQRIHTCQPLLLLYELPLARRTCSLHLHLSSSPAQTMGDRDRARERHTIEAMRDLLPEKEPSASQALAVATLLPLGGGLLALAGLTLLGSVIGLALLTPLLLLFSPVLVPAALLVALTVAGVLTSGALGLTGLSSIWYLLKQARGMVQKAPEQMENAKRRVGEAAQAARSRAEETKRA
ncbi:unnamed protein product [Musa hybrid cultivar]